MKRVGTSLENELVFGAHVREQRSRYFGYIGFIFGVIGCLSAAVVAVCVQKPAPQLVPFDVRNGVALPDVKVNSISVTQKDAIVQSLIYSYVGDREEYDFFDNDLRAPSVEARSMSQALLSYRNLWSRDSSDYLPKLYGDKARIDIVISSIVLQPGNRALVHIRKRLTSGSSITDGSFMVTLGYNLQPAKQDKLDEVWKNPFGFFVTDYRVVAQQYEQKSN